MKKILLFILIAFSFCSCLRPVEFIGISGFNVTEVKKEYVQLEVLAKIKNPNSFQFKIVDSDLHLKVNHADLGPVENLNKVIIPGNSEQNHKFVFKVQMGKLKSQILQLVSSFLHQKFDIELTGDIKVRWLIFSKRIPINEKTKQ